jgi:hypothetical protein
MRRGLGPDGEECHEPGERPRSQHTRQRIGRLPRTGRPVTLRTMTWSRRATRSRRRRCTAVLAQSHVRKYSTAVPMATPRPHRGLTHSRIENTCQLEMVAQPSRPCIAPGPPFSAGESSPLSHCPAERNRVLRDALQDSNHGAPLDHLRSRVFQPGHQSWLNRRRRKGATRPVRSRVHTRSNRRS